jgi:SpoVK/Ycf46/Vps4 family AAA+-type ATPase
MRASDAHHHLSSSNIVPFEALERLFASNNDIVGARYKDLLEELACITEYQWRSGATRGLVKGFLLSGPPGTGKTTLGKRLAYEMGCRFAGGDTPPPVMAFVDGGEISRSRYGESEERIRDIFVHAHTGFSAAGQRSVLLFDDVESIFMARGAEHAKEWHFSQDSVFFHAVDELDTSRSVIVLTSNRPDLIDEAIRDRFLSYVIDYPDVETLVSMVEKIEAIQHLPTSQSARMKDDLIAAARDGTVRSMRDAQRFAMRHYISNMLKRTSLAQNAS